MVIPIAGPAEIAELEEAAALGWRAPEEDRLGRWLLRAADGFSGRANSALAVGDPGLPLAVAAGRVRRWYAARGLPTLVAVPYPPGQARSSALDRFLARQGWTVRPAAVTVMTARAETVARAAARPRAGPPRVQVAAEPDEAWLARYHFRGRPELPPAGRLLLMSAPWQAFASVRAGGRVLAIGRVAIAAGWAGLTAVEVDPRHRRRGLATALTARLAALAAARGAGNLFLQVEDGNDAARALYHRIGFADHHGYHYRVAPGWPAAVAGGSSPGDDDRPGGLT
jgi:N-acetylglutamate synthase